MKFSTGPTPTGYLDSTARQAMADLSTTDLINPGRAPRNPVPYWVEAIKSEIVARWGPQALHYGGLIIHTTLDIALQEAVENTVEYGLSVLDRRLGFTTYAVASLEELRTNDQTSWSA